LHNSRSLRTVYSAINGEAFNNRSGGIKGPAHFTVPRLAQRREFFEGHLSQFFDQPDQYGWPVPAATSFPA
jgi:hypothetical protein